MEWWGDPRGTIFIVEKLVVKGPVFLCIRGKTYVGEWYVVLPLIVIVK
ncbi:hypothetical protein J2S16_004532 [Cytobacillus kochii]|nr:hypothetical protein [Cytobacillus kochii]